MVPASDGAAAAVVQETEAHVRVRDGRQGVHPGGRQLQRVWGPAPQGGVPRAQRAQVLGAGLEVKSLAWLLCHLYWSPACSVCSAGACPACGTVGRVPVAPCWQHASMNISTWQTCVALCVCRSSLSLRQGSVTTTTRMSAVLSPCNCTRFVHVNQGVDLTMKFHTHTALRPGRSWQQALSQHSHAAPVHQSDQVTKLSVTSPLATAGRPGERVPQALCCCLA